MEPFYLNVQVLVKSIQYIHGTGIGNIEETKIHSSAISHFQGVN